MTNLSLVLISTLVSLAAGGVGFYFLRGHITSEFDRLEALLHSTREHITGAIVNEVSSVEGSLSAAANSLNDHAQTLLGHSKAIHDATIIRDIAPSRAVSRN